MKKNNGSPLKVRILDGTLLQKMIIEQCSKHWLGYKGIIQPNYVGIIVYTSL